MRNVSSKKTAIFLTVLALIAGGLMPLALTQHHASAATAPDWVDARGPGNGDAMAMVYDNVHGILYRATMGEGGSVGMSGKGVWKYQAGTWTSLGGDVASLGINTLAYDSVGDCLYAGSNGGGVWCYDHSAGTWSETNAFMRVFYITSLAFGGGKLYAGVWDPNANSGLGAGLGVWSYDPAVPGAWTIDTGSVSTFRIEALAFGGGKLYAGCIDRSSGSEIAKGVWCYDPATATWTDTGGGMANRYSRVLAYDADHDLLYSGAGFTGVFCYDPDSEETDKWTNTAGTARFYEVTSLAWGEGKLYAGCNSMGPVVHNVVLRYDPDSIETDKWTDTGGDMAAYQFPSLAFDTVHHYLYVGTIKNGVWRYDLSNSPATWWDTRGGVSTTYIDSLAYDAVDNLLYVGTIYEGVRCYKPATATWTDTGGGVSTFEIFSLAWGGGKLYASCYDPNTSAYVGVWCYDPASPGPDKWTQTVGGVNAVRNLVYDTEHNLLYAGTGEYYTDNNNHGVWCYNPASPGWSDISSGDIDTFKIDSLALGGGKLYAGCSDPATSSVGVWHYDPANPSAGWSNTGGSVSTLTAYSLAWGGDKLYAGCWDWAQYPNVGKGVWCYDPSIPAPDKWSNTGGSVSTFAAYYLAWDGDKLYASCLNGNTQALDGVWAYDPASPDADKWTDTGGGISRYYVSSLLYDENYHRVYVGTGGMGAWYYGAPPVIDSLDPASAATGSEVTINGSSFGPGDSGSEYVTFGSVPAVVKPGTWTDTSVVCYVPASVSGNAPVTLHNLNGASNPVDFNVLLTYTVTASVNSGHGSVDPATQSTARGANATITITPDGGYHIASITDNGATATITNPYVINHVTENHGVVVTFEKDAPPEPTEEHNFYFAEGYTGTGFEEWLCLMNPGSTAATAHITYMFADGSVQTQDVPIGATTRATVDVNSVVGSGKNVSVKVTAAVPIVAERPMYFSYKGKWTGGHDVIGATSPGNNFYFAEGYTGSGFDEWLCLMNPGTAATTAHITYMFADGSVHSQDVGIGATTRATVDVNGEVGSGKNVSIKITSDAPIVAERPMYFNYKGVWTGGHDVVGTTAPQKTFYFAEGYTGAGAFDEWLCLANPNPNATVAHITYMFADSSTQTQDAPIGATSRATVDVNGAVGPDKNVSVAIVADDSIVAERPMYFNYKGVWTGGHDVVGTTAPQKTFYFAEGYTGAGAFDEWLCLANTNSTATTAHITYMFSDGSTQKQDVGIGSTSRATVNVNSVVGPDKNVSVAITADSPIVAERPMYFNYKGKWTGGHDVMGYTP